MKNITRKIVTVLSGVTLIGASIMGGVAQSYPSPFVQNSVWSGNIVVGSSAQPADILGSVDILSSLQFSMRQPAGVSNSQDPSINNGFKIQTSGQNFDYGDSIANVIDNTPLTQDDLPTILSDGKYVETEGHRSNDVTYSQKLTFQSDNAILQYTQDDQLAPTAGDYLVINRNRPLYEYSLQFDNPVLYDNSDSSTTFNDWKGTVIDIEGKPYTVSAITLSDMDGKISSISLLSGEASMWLQQNQPIIKSIDGVQHTIEVVDVTSQADACQIKVDGTTAIIDVDTTRVINGVQIGVTDVRAMHSQLEDNDVCQISVGASELQLDNNGNVKVDGTELEGTKVTFTENTPGRFEGIKIMYSPRNMEDTTYLKQGQAWTDPIFNSWKIVYGGVTANYNTYSIKTSGDHNANFKFTNVDNKGVTIPLYLNKTGSVIIGDGQDPEDQYYGSDASGYGDVLNSICTGTDSISDCEGMKIIATPVNNGEIHVFEITNIDTENKEVDVSDITYGRNYNSVKYDNGKLDLGSFGNLIGLNVVENDTTNTYSVAVSNTINSKMELKNKEKLTLDTSSSNVKMSLTEGDSSSNNNDNLLDILARKKTSDDQIELSTTFHNVGSETWSSSSLEEDSDYTVSVSSVGTRVVRDGDDKSVEVQSPKSDDSVYGNVFVSPISSEILNSYNNGTAYTINKIGVGASKLDNEISDIGAQNLIVVGGPAVNSVAARLLGLPFPTYGETSGVKPNTAIIKEIAQQNGRVAILVYGYSAEDTRSASRILANYDSNLLELSPSSSYLINDSDFNNIKITKTT